MKLWLIILLICVTVALIILIKRGQQTTDSGNNADNSQLLNPCYIHLRPGSVAPELADKTPFVAVVAISSEVSNNWRNEVSDWLVESGCRYMLAWGLDCSLWDDSVDWANLEKYEYKDVPDDKSIMTTWHEDESLDSVFWFAKTSAVHGSFELTRLIILDICAETREETIIERYEHATCKI